MRQTLIGKRVVARRVGARLCREVALVRLEFSEFIPRPAQQVFAYFQSPADWIRLYGFAGRVADRGDGWYAVPLKRFPFPLVAKVTALEPFRLVRWQFRGFWKGDGEVRLVAHDGGVQVEGHEQISARWLPGISPLLERLFMEREFRRIWALGWRRLRNPEHVSPTGAPASA